MTNSRSTALQDFIDSLQSSFADSRATSAEHDFARDLFTALAQPGVAMPTDSARLPVCQYLQPVLQSVARNAPELARLADCFERISSNLAWRVRASSGPHASETWPSGHANAVIIGSGGLEERDDVMIGASLLAPHVRYPDHDHPPEELYLVMTPGSFQHGMDDWYEPGPGGTFHNPPGIKHAMASGDDPLLTIWTMIIRPDA